MGVSIDKLAKSHTRRPGQWSRKGKLKRETKSCLIVAQNNDKIRTNHVKARIDKDATK